MAYGRGKEWDWISIATFYFDVDFVFVSGKGKVVFFCFKRGGWVRFFYILLLFYCIFILFSSTRVLVNVFL